MRLPAVLAAFLSALLLAGSTTAHATAHAAAYPVRDRVLTANQLYSSGKLAPVRCRERTITPDSAPRYLSAVLSCLNASWGAHFKRAGLPFTRARISFITKPRRYCGHAWDEAQAKYCFAENRFLVLLDGDVLKDPSDLYLFNVVAHEYGHHVQNLTGMRRAYDLLPYRGKKELNEQARRMELQAECLAGVFIGSVWKFLGRPAEDWYYLLELNKRSGDEQYKVRDHGKGVNMAAWLDRGFRASSPSACDTWSAPISQVS
ncbi:neutral zinc metallopeptidase [Nonomuraea sp. NPDC050404]|uniref:neutral zinc metallopeptidase n=1 Tax=Nonomuraea sp. NPDC050404 TaxID=3155783 RepID=UPI003407F131